MSNNFTLPFTLNKNPDTDGDRFLLECLKGELSFSFLSSECMDMIKELALQPAKNDLRFLHSDLIEIWPVVLVDALHELKRHSVDEYNKNNENMDSFFDPASLGIAELTNVLSGFSDFEGMLFGASPDRYRDHVAHSFRVWIIGHGILQSCLKHNLSPNERKIGNNVLNISSQEWEAMWAVIALCHDIGYPLSHIEKINEKASVTLKKQGLLHEGSLSFNFSSQMSLFHDTIIRMMSSVPIEKTENKYLTHLQNKYYLKYIKSFDNLDHGIISSLLISRALVYFLESDYSHDSRKSLSSEDVRQFYIRREILRAIASHTCQDIYHLTFDNLSLLLYLVDEIQCWGRPTLEQSQHEASDIEEGYATIEEFSRDSIVIRIKTKDSDWNKYQQKGVLLQILKLRKMLRLAPGRNKFTDNKLIFEVANENNDKLGVKMEDGGLWIYQNGISDDVIKSIPMLDGTIIKTTD